MNEMKKLIFMLGLSLLFYYPAAAQQRLEVVKFDALQSLIDTEVGPD